MYNYDKAQIAEALNYLNQNYPDKKANNNISIVSNSGEPYEISEQYQSVSMKQSVFRNVIFMKSEFSNVAFAGSLFDNVKVVESIANGNSFVDCNFFNAQIFGDNKEFSANNFSHSHFESSTLQAVVIYQSGILHAQFHKCYIQKVVFRSSTIEETSFINCQLCDCDFSHSDLYFTYFTNNTFDNVIFPFYQIPYIVGAATFINDVNQKVFLRVDDRVIPMTEYNSQIDRLIIFYLDKSEYFPACNLCLAKADIKTAKDLLMLGINKALGIKDFRTISHLCELARYHNIIEWNNKTKIIDELEAFIKSDAVEDDQLNYYLFYIEKIKAILNDNKPNMVTLNYTINTNTNKNDSNGRLFVNNLMDNLNDAISKIDIIDEFEIKLTSHSPFEIIVNIMSIAGSMATIAGLVLNIIASSKKQASMPRIEEINRDIYAKYIDCRIDTLKSELLEVLATNKDKKMNRYITQVTQSLKTDIEELYDKDIIIYKIKNDT